MRMPSSRKKPTPTRALWLFASLWSLRQYPTLRREWSWPKKFSAIRAAGFDGVFSPIRPELAERGDLRYIAIASLEAPAQVREALTAARKLGAITVDVQLGDYDTPLAEAVKLAVRIRDVGRELGLPFTIETHRDTFTETPEATLALMHAYERAAGEKLPLCLDHSHFAVVRHLREDQLWERLQQPQEMLAAALQVHLRPFNGHHVQLPALDARGRRTREYEHWLNYTAALFAQLQRQNATEPLVVVPEIGNAAPAYGLSCFGDTWRDVRAVARDLRRQWRDAAS